MRPLRYMFVDFDAFFAGCEQQLQPALRGRAIGVTPADTESTCVIAASYEARRFGVKVGTRVREARLLCPGIQMVPARPNLYVQIHNRAREIVEAAVGLDAVESIDEMVSRLPSGCESEALACRVAEDLRQRLREGLGAYVTCSIGLAGNRFWAKIASGWQKPAGLTILRPEALPADLQAASVRELHQVGKQMTRRLNRAGIVTVADLLRQSRGQMRALWGGVVGERMYEALQGEDRDPLPTARGMFGHAHVLAPEFRDYERALAVAHRLLQKAALRLRHEGYVAGAMGLQVRLGETGAWQSGCRFTPTDETLPLTRTLNTLWRACPRHPPPKQVFVTLGELTPLSAHTPSFFSEVHDPRRQALDRVMDSLNIRYGNRTVYYAPAHRGRHAAPMRIAFHHVPELTIERDADA